MTPVEKKIVSFVALLLIGTANTLRSVQIHVPKAVLTGQDAELMCTYELEGAQLYSIRWYKNMVEFYRYVPKESPATKVFPVAEIKVDVATSDQNRVVLQEVDRTLTGEYQCEVSADAPLFHTEIKSSEMVVVEPPLISPNVTSDKMTYTGGDHIHVNCSSPPSLPAANITWFVNEQMVPGFTASHTLNFSNGYASSLATLELEAAVMSPVPTLMIRCEAAIFDVWKSTSHTLVLRERSANPASALGRSFTGSSAETCLPTIMVLLLQIFLQIVLSYAETLR
ncbi:uncharacterized protein LOC106135268 [Amyelois transitella]|uniref:uncharacterized protein LOC106135268 n=1 Tax=Amyelois transitella TaxID=680683 RepID=UPI00067AF7EB|nr:uncharacterized protein LOC106135268 [Amyelois transitella]XP_013190970.1 uncharacterized protein LOC106135268 [Amyelois transitella]XP_013190971.1 uncharacterized protein LOC106135268 [Amyelois transitella]XP_060807819.1 uncharacterized protein LOC106135268 [Amyelois transitella]